MSGHPDTKSFLIWCPEKGETEGDAMVLFSSDPEMVVEEWAEYTDTEGAEYTIVAGKESPVVMVRERDRGKGVWKQATIWKVSGRSIPEYTAQEVKGD